MKFTLVGAILFFNLIAFAYEKEDFQAYKEKYKGELAVVLNHDQKLEASINKKTGELELYRTETEEVLYLTESANFYTKKYISLSEYFQDIVYTNAVVIDAKGKKYKVKKDAFTTVDAEPSSWVFHDDDKEVVFDLNKLGEGYRSIITYTKKLKKPEFFGLFDLIRGYPMEKGKVTLSYPNSIKIKSTELNINGYGVSYSKSNKKDQMEEVWDIADVPAYKSEKGSVNLRYFIPQIYCTIESYEFNGKTTNVMSSVDDLHAYFQEFLLAKENEKDRGEINRTVREITEGMETELEKMDTIFKWVQTNIKYIAFEDGKNGYVPRSCTKVMKDRYGDCKDMGNLLTEMLTYAKVKNAHVAWVGTRDIPYQMSELPSPYTCNHVICVVDRLDSGYYYLDATSSEVSYLIPPSNIQGKELLIHYGQDKYKLFKVKPTDASINKYVSTIRMTFSDQDSIFGNGTDSYQGYQRERRSYKLKNYESDDLYDYVKSICLDGYSKFTLKDYNMENLEDNNATLKLNYDFSFKNSVLKDGDKLIFNPDIFDINGSFYYKDDYKQKQYRKYHTDKTYIYELEIPENFELVYIPENTSFSHDKFNFQATYEMKGNVLIVKRHFTIELLELPPDLFDEWNKFSKAMNQAAMQNVILTKKNK